MTDNDDQAMRDFTKRLFSHSEESDQPIPEPPNPNHVSREGVFQEPKGDPVRNFTRQLFGYDD